MFYFIFKLVSFLFINFVNFLYIIICIVIFLFFVLEVKAIGLTAN